MKWNGWDDNRRACGKTSWFGKGADEMRKRRRVKVCTKCTNRSRAHEKVDTRRNGGMNAYIVQRLE